MFVDDVSLLKCIEHTVDGDDVHIGFLRMQPALQIVRRNGFLNTIQSVEHKTARLRVFEAGGMWEEIHKWEVGVG